MKRYCLELDEPIQPIQEKSIVDQFPAEDFNVTPHGTLRNDVAALVAAQTEQEFNLILSRLMQLREDDQYQNMSDTELLQRIKPRMMQDPAELERFGEYVGQLDNFKLELEKEKTALADTPSVESNEAAE